MKSFWKNATTFTKIIIVVIVLGGLYFGINYLSKSGAVKTEDEQVAGKLKVSDEADIVVGYNTFPGMEGLLFMNGGMEPSEDSRIFKEFGIKVQIKQIDIVADAQAGLKAGVLDAIYCTVDALPISMGSGSDLLDSKAKVRLKINESRGADAIVVTKGINKVSDLKGKKVAFALGTASNTLLINVLETSGMSMKDIETMKVSDGVEAAGAFKAGQCDAAVVWAPDDEDCIAAVKGSKVLISTSTATQIIADGLLIRDDIYEQKKDQFVALGKAWLTGNGILNSDPGAKSKANVLFAKGFNFDEAVAAAGADKVRFSTLADNKAFFGLEPTYTGVTGEKMYSRMAVKYTDADLANGPAPWKKVSSDDLVDAIASDAKLSGDPNQGTEKVAKFEAPTKADETIEATGSKKVTLEFETASAELDDQDKTIIDREVTAIAQAFSKARVRVEGNTDNTGNPKSNKALSLKRAQAVVNYLINEHKFDKNKFIVIGNGQDKPVADNATEEGKQANRRTDFQFIW